MDGSEWLLRFVFLGLPLLYFGWVGIMYSVSFRSLEVINKIIIIFRPNPNTHQ